MWKAAQASALQNYHYGNWLARQNAQNGYNQLTGTSVSVPMEDDMRVESDNISYQYHFHGAPDAATQPVTTAPPPPNASPAVSPVDAAVQAAAPSLLGSLIRNPVVMAALGGAIAGPAGAILGPMLGNVLFPPAAPSGDVQPPPAVNSAPVLTPTPLPSDQLPFGLKVGKPD